MTIRSLMIITLLNNLEIAQKNKLIRNPYSWALYQTWKTVDHFEKEREKG